MKNENYFNYIIENAKEYTLPNSILGFRQGMNLKLATAKPRQTIILAAPRAKFVTRACYKKFIYFSIYGKNRSAKYFIFLEYWHYANQKRKGLISMTFSKVNICQEVPYCHDQFKDI